MANYSTLKASVNAYIKANGVRAITGPVLNGILTQMINTLGDGARYGGIATPSGNPGTHDNVVFFLATAAGTYTNYGGSVLDGSTLHILYYDSTWHDLDTGVPTSTAFATKADKDEDAVEGNIAMFDSNGNPVDGGVSVDALNQLGQEVADIRFSSEAFIWSVTKAAGAGVTYPIAISPGIKVLISLTGVSSQDTVNCLGYDKDGTLIGLIFKGTGADASKEYLATNGLSALRVTDNAHSSVTLSVRKPISESELLQMTKGIEFGVNNLIDTISIPQRGSAGGTDFPIVTTLKKGVPYTIIKTCTNPAQYNNLKFRFGTTDVAYLIDGVRFSSWAFISDGAHNLMLESDANAIRSSDNTGTAVEIKIYEAFPGVYNMEQDIKNGLYPLLENKPQYDFATKNQGLCIDDYISSIAAYRVIASSNGFKFLDALNNNIVTRLTYENTVHDSQVVVKNGVAFVVYAANTAISDNASSPTSKVILSKFTVADPSDRTDLIVAKNGEQSLTGGAGQPNIVADETDSDLLHIVFTANKSGYTIMTCDYSIASGTCSNYREVVISNKTGTTGNARNTDINTLFGKTFDSSSYYSPQCNSTIAYLSGYYYIGFVIGTTLDKNKNLAVIFKTANFTDWAYFADYEKFDTLSHCELAIGIDEANNIYSASRVFTADGMGQYGACYGIIAKWNASGVLQERRYYRNPGSRPSFFRNGNDLYLFSNDWYRSICDVILINKYQLTAAQLFAQFKKSAFHYVSFAVNGDNVVVSSSSDGIEISQIEWPTSTTENEAYNKLRSLLE